MFRWIFGLAFLMVTACGVSSSSVGTSSSNKASGGLKPNVCKDVSLLVQEANQVLDQWRANCQASTLLKMVKQTPNQLVCEAGKERLVITLQEQEVAMSFQKANTSCFELRATESGLIHLKSNRQILWGVHEGNFEVIVRGTTCKLSQADFEKFSQSANMPAVEVDNVNRIIWVGVHQSSSQQFHPAVACQIQPTSAPNLE